MISVFVSTKFGQERRLPLQSLNYAEKIIAQYRFSQFKILEKASQII